ncbi:mitochondrial import inner membrane translocase subunit TIM50-C [Phlebotomus argentipes]|uniref:mitochondrial import inner membrane translocase subunit TIM50-C n=1 Tax=Phlebotomus argentipes TaxID=94469 RepID=UPI0028929F5B|nr:mitochondrial import inner membrane translocase subunit TIM50-C [Phlebotomus argentipes]
MAQRCILSLSRCLQLSRVAAPSSPPHGVFKSSSFARNISLQTCNYAAEVNKPSQDAQAGPQLLTKLFPHTAVPEKSQEELERERKEQEEKSKKEKEKSWKHMKIGFMVFGASAGIMGAWAIYDLGSPERDAAGKVIEDEFSKMPVVQQYFKRMWKSMTYYQKMIQEPSREKLLPDPVKPPYIQPPYTLVLEMKDVLVHPDWTYQTGWRFKKRPGVDNFLEQLARHFEIVVYTADQGMTVFPILDVLDPNGYIMYRLVRDATHFVDGHHVKNLDNLNRDLSKVIVIDWDPNSTKLHPENTFNLSRWTGNDDDATLFDLVAFLQTIAVSEVDDVREVLQYYRQFDNPLEQFRENQRKFYEHIQEKEREESGKPVAPVKKWTPSFLASK